MSSPALDLVYLRPAIAHDGSEIVRVIGPLRPEGVPLIVYHREPTNAKANEICDDESCAYCYPNSLSEKRMVASEPTRESLRAEANAKLDALRARATADSEARVEERLRGLGAFPKKKRRTKKEMAAFRAELAAKQAARTAELPEWLQEKDEMLEAILANTETR